MKRRACWLLVCLVLACGERDSGPSTVTVSGRVRLDALAFAGGVRVEVLKADGTPTGDETTSDSAGHFAVEVPARAELIFRCTSAGSCPTNSRIIATGETALEGVELWIFTLAERTRAASGAAAAAGQTADLVNRGLVVGILYDESRYPVTGTRVTISNSDGQTGIAYRDPDGVYGQTPFTMGFLPTHQFAVVNVPAGEFTLRQDVDSREARAMSVAGEVTAVILRGLPVYTAVVGAVMDEVDSPVAGATVQAYTEAGVLLAETTSDAEGVFVITRLIEGTEFYLHAEAATGYVAGNTRYYVLGSDPFITVAVALVSITYHDDLIVEMEADMASLGFTHDPTKAFLAARLVYRGGQPIKNETVTVTPDSGQAGYLDSSGSFDDTVVDPPILYTDTRDATGFPQWVAANVEPGTVELGQSMDSSTLKLPCRAGEITYVSLDDLSRRVRINGTVQDETGAGVVGATVVVYGTSISTVTVGAPTAGRFQLTGKATDKLLAGSRVTLQVVSPAGYNTTNTPYIDLPDSDLAYGSIVLMTANGTDGYYDVLVSEFIAANGGSVGGGVIVGAVRDIQSGPGPGKVDGAKITQSPSSGLLDYLYDDAGADKFGGPAVTETDDQVTGFTMFMAVNVTDGDVTLTEDWDGTELDCPVRAGEVTIADFRKLTPQNTVGGWVFENNSLFAFVEGATVELYDTEGNLVASDVTAGPSGRWEIKGIRPFKRLYASSSKTGYVTTNTPYQDIESSDTFLTVPLYSSTFEIQLTTAWGNVYGAPDLSTYGAVTGDLVTTFPAKLAGETAGLRDVTVEVGYLDASEEFGVETDTQADPQMGGEAAPQFHMFDVPPGDYILEQSADGMITRIPVRAGEYTQVGVGGIAVIPANRTVDISGTITDDEKPVPNPIAGAVVRIPDSPYSTVTALDGTYTLLNVPARQRITVVVSKDGTAINTQYFEAYATGSLDLPIANPVMLDLLTALFEAEAGALDSENRGIVLGSVQRSGAPVEGVRVTLSTSAGLTTGVTVYFDQYLRAGAPYTQEETGLQFMIGDAEPGDTVLTQDHNWQRMELPSRAGEWTLGFVDLRN